MTIPSSGQEDETLRWRVHPARERMGAALFAAGVVLVLAWLAADLMQDRWWGVASGVFLFLMLNRFFLPSHFSVDQEGVTARFPLRTLQYRWTEVRRFLHDENGGYLSTRRRGSLLDSFRGIQLIFAGNSETVAARIDAVLEKSCRQRS
ncbi:MAG: hypothetical protein IID45_08295, partial [Planctomycetes bacterium]|nr:hypothetical protein [Planctomycetota bacterium]